MKSTSKMFVMLAGAVALAAPAALAGPHGGGGPGLGPPAPGAIQPSLGRFGATPPLANPGDSVRDDARVNREGPNRASATGTANANENAGLSSATASDLTGLKTGLTVKDSGGAVLGTVRKIEKSKDGTVRNVLVASADGKRTIRLAPTTISLSGDVVMTTSH